MDTVFSETLRYADEGKDAAARRFDGNISETSFSHRVVSGYGTPYLQTNTWSCAYDGMKRLTGAGHYVGAAQTPSSTDTEREIAYDRNGNITHLKRYGSTGLENDIAFTHTGNRMTSLSDANATGSASGSKSFTYDANGNLISDGRKGLEFSWNVLNLVSGATAHDGSSLKYSWLSDGTKVSASEDDGNGNVIKRHYVGSFVFVEVPVSGEWLKESVCWDEGRIFFDVPFIVDSTVVDDPLVEDRGYRDCWYATDHLGNVRAVIDITPGQAAPVVLEQSDYLPFGTKILNPSHASMQANRWRYAGKEEQDFGSLNLVLLDFGARMYDPFTARWTAVDPLAGKYTSHSPYNYCGGNPIVFFDPNGLDWKNEKEIQNLEKQIDRVIKAKERVLEKSKNTLSKEGISKRKEKRVRERIKEKTEEITYLKRSKEDIQLLRDDHKHVYSLRNSSDNKHFVQQSDGIVYIDTSSDAIAIHEISHVRQALSSGDLRFNNQGFLLNPGHNAREKAINEVEAYRIQYSFDHSFPGKVYSINDISVSSVGNIIDNDGNYVYPFIRSIHGNSTGK